MSADITLCILDLDGGEMLVRCLESIEAQTTPAETVIVIDNGSRIPVAGRVNQRPWLEVIRFESNTGFAAGANAACSRATTGLVAFVNNDVTLDPRWIERTVPAFSEKDVAAAQTVVLRKDGRVDSAGIAIERGGFVQVMHGEAPPPPMQLLDVWGVAGAAAVYRRDVIGDRPFNERLFAWYEDVDLAARLADSGWRSVLITDPLAVHLGSASASALPMRGLPLRTRNRYLVARSRRIGSVLALLREDVVQMGRSALRGRVTEAFAVLRGAGAGLLGRKLPDLRVRSAPQ